MSAASQSGSEGAFRVTRADARLHFEGKLTLDVGVALWATLARETGAVEAGAVLDFDLSGVQAIDGAAMALLVDARAQVISRGARCSFVDTAPCVRSLVHLYAGDRPPARPHKRKPRGVLDQIGAATLEIAQEVQLVLAFLGALIVEGREIIRSPRTGNWREIPSIMERSGADAVPIVLLINFLVGLVMAFQASVQLQRFGAQILVADLIGISMTRELGPLMTAIVVTGRSGAAFAAELGTMKVNEEIDALRTLGLSPLRYLVFPRSVGLMLVMPLLAVLADVMGILGGLVVGVFNLNLSVTAYLHQSQKVIKLWDVFSGLIKSGIFAQTVALIACQQGLAASSGAEGVGRRTTSAVVSTLFALILIDAIFTVLFRVMGR